MDYESNRSEVSKFSFMLSRLAYIYRYMYLYLYLYPSSHGCSEQPLLRSDENTLTLPQDLERRCNPSVTDQEPEKGLQISDLQSRVLASGRMQLSSPDVSKVTYFFQS